MPEKWDQVKELFPSALELDAAERSAFLRQACGDDLSLRNEIESLLSSFDESASFLEDSFTPSLLSAQSYAMAGNGLARTASCARLGMAAVAVVYLAERADERQYLANV